MADRTSAGNYAAIFQALADDKSKEELIEAIWNMACEADFSPYQMYSDAALIKLGLAKRGVRDAFPDDGEVMLYRGLDYES